MSVLARVFILLAFAVLFMLGHPSQAQETANNSQFPPCQGHNQAGTVIIGNRIDEDDDGLNDFWELHWFDDLNENAAGDPEEDSVSNGTEEANGTYPVQVPGSGIDSRDTDGDGLWDGEEIALGTRGTTTDTDFDGFTDYEEVKGTCGYVTDPKDQDTDDDRLTDWQEVKGDYNHLPELFQTDPTKFDSDDDGLSDCLEVFGGVDPLDCDADGLYDDWELYWFDSLYPTGTGDLDRDGCNNECEEAYGTCPIQAGCTAIDSRDTDGDGLYDGDEVFVHDTDGTDPDTDDDGLSDYDEVFVHVTDPNVPDTDGDGLTDGQEIAGVYDHLTGVYPTDPLNPDSDADGLTDYDELYAHLTNPLLLDTDGDTLLDGDEINIHQTSPNLTDTDADGLTDPYEVNTVHASGHKTLAYNPDTDGDILLDGAELNSYGTKPWAFDSDGDRLSDYDEIILRGTNPNNTDTDNDMLFDADEVEIYLTDPAKPDTDEDTIRDGDEIACGTSPLLVETTPGTPDSWVCGVVSTDPDSDDDTLADVWEMTMFGTLQFGPMDDPDADSLNNEGERNQGTHANMYDTDGDGRSDGQEVFGIGGPTSNPKNPDTDLDGLNDGDEVNVYSTNPNLADTDGDTLSDPAEIATHKTNPTKADTDADGLTDPAEIATHLTNPVLPDTDTDGLSDGAEINLHQTNPLMADTDTDGLNDGAEINTYASDPLKPDTDGDGVQDGAEIGCGTSPTAASTFPPYPDSDYCAGTASVELLSNGGFEEGMLPDKSPVGWTLKNALGDKVKCDPLKAHAGNCAFRFRGGAAENTHLTQIIDLTGVTFRQGDSLALSAFFKGGNPAVKAKFILTVVYADGTPPVQKVATVGPRTGYSQVVLPVVPLGAVDVQQISVKVKHKSLAGVLWLDSASLTLTPAPIAVRLDALPPAVASASFRGSN